MKHNTQILSFQNIEPIIEDRQVMVNYTLEGESKHLMIPFEHLSSFLTQHRVKVAGYNDSMGIEELDILWWSEETICETVEAFIRNYERFDLIVENRKLRDKVGRLESKLRDANRELERKLQRVANVAYCVINAISDYKRLSWIERIVYGKDFIKNISVGGILKIKEVCDERN